MHKIKKILVSQPKPTGLQSPYLKLAEKHQLDVSFQPFVTISPLSFHEFRKQGVNITDYTAVIFTSRRMIDQFFRLMQEGKIEVSPAMRYFCISEQTANYLHKHIVVKRRKVYKGEGKSQDVIKAMKRYSKEQFLFPRSDREKNEISDFLQCNAYAHKEVLTAKTIPSDLSNIAVKDYDLITFFNSAGVRSFLQHFPSFFNQQEDVKIACFGASTLRELELAGKSPDIQAPSLQTPSLVDAIDAYLRC